MAAQDLLMSHAVEIPPAEAPNIKAETVEIKTEASEFAENECAMALLCLATTSVPMKPKVEVKEEEEEEEDKWSGDPEGYCILKRQLRLHVQQESDAVKRIRLDHNYAWSGHAGLKTGYKGDGSLYEREGFISEMGYCPPGEAKKAKRRSPKAKRSTPTKGKSSSPKDVYEPNDSKYNNLNLLLKCLTKEEDKSEGEEARDHPCDACPKVFSKKRYLTKHQLRMHEEASQVACPTCGDLITKSTLSQHAVTCAIGADTSDLADCQFCGIRMRRHILEKHLALEHCQGDDELSDSSTLSGSEHDRDDVAMATSPRRPLRHIVPNEPGFDFSLVQRNTVSCQLCGQRVSRMQLTEHLSSVHSVGAKQKKSCKHSMLQRFLNDDQKTEECESCVSRLNNNYRATNSSGNSDCRSSEGSPSPKEFSANDYTLLVKKASVSQTLALPYSTKLVDGDSI